jgi:hypothetical protein
MWRAMSFSLAKLASLELKIQVKQLLMEFCVRFSLLECNSAEMCESLLMGELWAVFKTLYLLHTNGPNKL